MEIEQNISLANLTTLKVGGSADFFARVRNSAELKSALDFADSKKIPVFVFGGGSNILFADAGFRGLVIHNEIGGIEFANNFVRVGSGENLANLIAQTAQKNLAGLENLAGVPGSVGGAVVGNSNEIGEKISRVTIFENGTEKILERADLKFEYRDSNLRDKILLAVEFELKKSSLDLPQIIQTKIAEKVQKQEFKNTAGSWFKNPVGQKAWELIEQSAARNLKVGGARISAKHANFFENAGGATAADFLELEKKVVAAVEDKFGVKLEREVVVVSEQ
ncbi:MAG: UDP-N-acetylmuramate dehydrogenase [Patescibacteria group bacterium]